MVVEDNPTNLKLTIDLLELEGFEVCACVDAMEALEKLKDFRPDLVLTDIGLPGIDGYQLAHTLRLQETTKHLIIVALTAFAMKEDKKKVLDAGCDGYIAKPIDTRQFGKTIQGFLGKTV